MMAHACNSSRRVSGFRESGLHCEPRVSRRLWLSENTGKLKMKYSKNAVGLICN